MEDETQRELEAVRGPGAEAVWPSGAQAGGEVGGSGRGPQHGGGAGCLQTAEGDGCREACSAWMPLIQAGRWLLGVRGAWGRSRLGCCCALGVHVLGVQHHQHGRRCLCGAEWGCVHEWVVTEGTSKAGRKVPGCPVSALPFSALLSRPVVLAKADPGAPPSACPVPAPVSCPRAPLGRASSTSFHPRACASSARRPQARLSPRKLSSRASRQLHTGLPRSLEGDGAAPPVLALLPRPSLALPSRSPRLSSASA